MRSFLFYGINLQRVSLVSSGDSLRQHQSSSMIEYHFDSLLSRYNIEQQQSPS